jgi:hypothetical protein
MEKYSMLIYDKKNSNPMNLINIKKIMNNITI